MINVHVLDFPQLTSVGYWRMYRPLQVVRRLYPGVFNFTFGKKGLFFSDAAFLDIVICPRPGSRPDVNDFIFKAQYNGAKVIVDIDDHLFDLPMSHDLYHDYKKGSDTYKMAEKTLKMADLFWYSTPEFFKYYPRNGIVCPNAILPHEMPDEPCPNNGNWAWRGRSIQTHDLIGAGWDWYARIKDRPKKWLFIGFLPPLRHGENATSIPHIDDVQEYMDKLKSAQLNGIWKPMVEHPFNDCKSNIAWIEATMAGGVCLTNYAGKPGWELTTKHFPTYKEACDLWEKSKQKIATEYNLVDVAHKRARSMLALLPHYSSLLSTSPSTEETLA